MRNISAITYIPGLHLVYGQHLPHVELKRGEKYSYDANYGKNIISFSNAYLVGVGGLEEYGQAVGEERGGNVVHHGAVRAESLIFFFKKS